MVDPYVNTSHIVSTCRTISSCGPQFAHPFYKEFKQGLPTAKTLFNFVLGDPNTDKHLAALCSQLQSQKSNEAMNKTLKTSGKNKSSVFEKSLPTANQISPKAHETLSASSKSTLLNDETTAHKRKQPNPMSINNLCDVSVDEEIAEKISDSLRRTPTVTSSDSCKNSNKQETPSSNQEVSLTNCDPKLPAAGCAVEPVQSSSSRDVPKSSESLSKDGEVARKQSDSKSSAESFSEKDLMAFIQALTSNPGSSGSQSLERIEKLLSTCSNLLRSGQNMGLNAVNELLTAVVTTEMQRLQTEKANLTRELKLFNKNDTLTALNKQVKTHAFSFYAFIQYICIFCCISPFISDCVLQGTTCT